jgi:hypothetical protein
MFLMDLEKYTVEISINNKNKIKTFNLSDFVTNLYYRKW